MGIVGSILLKGKEIYRTTADKRHPLGTRAYTRDGRIFRYARNGGTALAVGKLVQAEAPPTDFSDDQPALTGKRYTSGSSAMVVYMSSKASVGSTEDTFKEGYLFVNDGGGEGMMVQVLRQGRWTTASTLHRPSTIDFADGAIWTTLVSTQASTASQLGIVKNLYDDVIIAPATLTSVPVGVTPRAVAINYYFWVQTWGPAVTQVNSAGTGIPAAGFPLVPATVAGAVSRYWGFLSTDDSSQSWAGGDVRVTLMKYGHMTLGNCIEVGADGESGLVDLKIAP